jgi:hypothetical protein
MLFGHPSVWCMTSTARAMTLTRPGRAGLAGAGEGSLGVTLDEVSPMTWRRCPASSRRGAGCHPVEWWRSGATFQVRMVGELGRVVNSGPTNYVPEPLPASRFSISHHEWHHGDRLTCHATGINGFAAAQQTVKMRAAGRSCQNAEEKWRRSSVVISVMPKPSRCPHGQLNIPPQQPRVQGRGLRGGQGAGRSADPCRLGCAGRRDWRPQPADQCRKGSLRNA